MQNTRTRANKPCRVLFLLLILALAGWFLQPIPPLYTVTDLGAGSGGPAVEASAVNNQGQVLVNDLAQITATSQSNTPGSLESSTSVWQADALTQPIQPSPWGASGSAINDKGQITGAVGTSQSDNQAFLFSAGRMRGLGTLPGYAGSFGTGINARGQIVGAVYLSNAGVTGSLKHAFLYNGGRMTALPLLPGKPESQAYGINSLGQVVGDCTQGFSNSRAFLYDSSTQKMTALPMPPGNTNSSFARGINDRGQVIGEIYTSEGGGHATLWQGGSVKDLGTPPGTDMSIGLAINNQGQAVGNSFNDSDTGLSRFLKYLARLRVLNGAGGRHSPESAFVYRDGRMHDLNSLIPSRSGWVLEEAHGINDRGQIVGRGLHHGQERAFLLTPVR